MQDQPWRRGISSGSPRLVIVSIVAILALITSCAGIPEEAPSPDLPRYTNTLALEGIRTAIPDGWFFELPGERRFDSIYRFRDPDAAAFGSVERIRAAEESNEAVLSFLESIVFAPIERQYSMYYGTEEERLPVAAAQLAPGWEQFAAILPLHDRLYALTVAFDIRSYPDPWPMFQGMMAGMEETEEEITIRRFPGRPEIRVPDVVRQRWAGEERGVTYFKHAARGAFIRYGVHRDDPQGSFPGEREDMRIALDDGAYWTRIADETALAVYPLEGGLYLSVLYPCLPEEGPESIPAAEIQEVFGNAVPLQ